MREEQSDMLRLGLMIVAMCGLLSSHFNIG